jgi:23S rRNA (adenine2503-C2)-methyltransferase
VVAPLAPGDGATRAPLEWLPDEWEAAMRERGQPAYRALQVFRWIHARGVTDPQAMTDLPKALRADLAALGLAPAASLDHVHRSADDSRKLLVGLAGDEKIETVLLPVVTRGEDDDDDEPAAARVTQCVSSQVGCAMGCVFCASGIAGLKRHMTAAEIVSQVLLGRAQLDEGERLKNLVFMGMGEPLHNYEALHRAIVLLTHPEGLALSPRRITVSTSGLVPGIDRLGADFGGQIALAVSLHQADDARRSELVPINKKHPLPELVKALRRYPLRRGKRVTIEYTLIAGQNDSAEDARKLGRLLAGLPVKINLIPMNGIPHSKLGPPPEERIDAFQQALVRAGHLCFRRRLRGDDVAAACGQLALDEAPKLSFLRRQPRSPD